MRLTATRYWDPATSSPDGYTIICAHATGFHKEHFEPTIQDLYAILPSSLKVREVWTVDAANSGAAADLNEEYLRWGFDDVFGWQEYAREMHAFLAGLGTGLDGVDFSKHRLVLVGHSFGAVAQILAQTFHPQITPEILILLEITCYRPDDPRETSNYLAEGAAKRRDVWPSRDAAYEQFKSRQPWKGWDPRVLRLYVDHGLRPLPSLEYPHVNEGVTLRCTRRQETATYRDRHGVATAYRTIASIAHRVPTHLVYGAIANHLRPEQIEDFLENGIGRKRIASLRRVQGAGHLIVQTHPRVCAEIIVEIMAQANARSRL
uniref:AB hydrolase-1 domain-containing protein n=1 Tax=Mycena chlorophos TaxID=658473 RepID=A0ABQ0MCX7_MYCCL|nr:predicted protein [Mycena chlorophos]